MSAYTAWWAAGSFLGGLACLAVMKWYGMLRPRVLPVFLLGGALTLAGAKLQFLLQSMSFWDALGSTAQELLEPGRRMPLGLVLGGLGALSGAAALRVPWRQVGDALCVGGSVMEAIGRLGCFAAGCCMGSICPVALGAICVRVPAGSPVHNHQLREGVISLTMPESLPVHPLPVYFALAALITLGAQLVLLRGRAVPGTAMLLFVTFGSAIKLALEFLRGSAPGGPSGLMLWLPATGIVAGLVAWLADGGTSRDVEPEAPV